MKHWFLLALLVLVGCQPIGVMRESDNLTAVGYASISEQAGKNIDEKRIRAMRASKVDAYRELAEQVYGMRISGKVEMNDQQLGEESTSAGVDGIIRGAEVVRTYPVGDSYVTELKLNLKKMDRMKSQGQVYDVPSTQRKTTLF
ncbi:LPP20 family lipoprotein [Aliivibrio fischeri]|uniref:LPP20 family lipoprotein n=1 Tax=Aliivibrio fischeri TaxID=668 RepID=UPI0007C4A197|nr:LPP20 family lipoprotein [Aliivibrio fischeri]MBP3142542.1 LPP20 family lipoprotein [Aliivibrio fischeri]MBP3156833.1 LPP20 family lipoprotein [Aliivibrio fischeri]MCE7535225.1 LPP20 family lipoprotein [Aliivibrio fischeri]MCE7554554.1 LPP20 family lipoprotein [Aliivibrio fischeri]MCE7558120.1 LPP20 family lipoprotein [Aliivibrio fischeri]